MIYFFNGSLIKNKNRSHENTTSTTNDTIIVIFLCFITVIHMYKHMTLTLPLIMSTVEYLRYTIDHSLTFKDRKYCMN